MNKEWFTRFPQEHVDQTYLDNITKITKFFINWFRGRDFSYREMLTQMHKMMSINYQGYTNGNYILKSSSGFRGEQSTTWYPILRKEWFVGVSQRYPIIRPKIKYVPIGMGHWIEDKDEGYVLHLPDGKYVYYYLAMMEMLMYSLRREKFNYRMLANYINLFVIGHPFERINFSICMAQVNAILSIWNCKTIYHGYLDFECFMYDYDKIEEIFINSLEKDQNETTQT